MRLTYPPNCTGSAVPKLFVVHRTILVSNRTANGLWKWFPCLKHSVFVYIVDSNLCQREHDPYISPNSSTLEYPSLCHFLVTTAWVSYYVSKLSKWVLSGHNLRPIKPLPQGYQDNDYRYEKRSLRRVFCYQTRGIASNISSLTIKWKLSFWQRNNNMAALISYAGFWIFKSKMQNIYRLYHTRRWWKAWTYYSSKPNDFGNYRLLNT